MSIQPFVYCFYAYVLLHFKILYSPVTCFFAFLLLLIHACQSDSNLPHNVMVWLILHFKLLLNIYYTSKSQTVKSKHFWLKVCYDFLSEHACTLGTLLVYLVHGINAVCINSLKALLAF